MRYIPTFLAILFLSINSLSAAPWAKLDAGPVYVHIDVLESERTVRDMDLFGASLDASFVIYKGWMVKSHFLYAANDGYLASAGCAVGHCIPLFEKFTFFPLLDVTSTYLKTDIPFVFPFVGTISFDEKFCSISVAPGLEMTYCICKGLRFNMHFHYAWSRTETEIEDLFSFISYSWGPSISGQIEYDLNDCFSLNLGAAYNSSLSREKHGLRGYGVRFGFAYWLD